MDTNLTNINFLTDNNVGDYNPQISDKNVVWSSDDGDDHDRHAVGKADGGEAIM